MVEIKFIEGMIAKKPHEKAPAFVKVNLSVKIADFLFFANRHSKNGWMNITIKESKGGKFYAELDTYEPRETPPEYGGNDKGYENTVKIVQENVIDYPEEDINPDGIPF